MSRFRSSVTDHLGQLLQFHHHTPSAFPPRLSLTPASDRARNRQLPTQEKDVLPCCPPRGSPPTALQPRCSPHLPDHPRPALVALPLPRGSPLQPSLQPQDPLLLVPLPDVLRRRLRLPCCHCRLADLPPPLLNGPLLAVMRVPI